MQYAPILNISIERLYTVYKRINPWLDNPIASDIKIKCDKLMKLLNHCCNMTQDYKLLETKTGA